MSYGLCVRKANLLWWLIVTYIIKRPSMTINVDHYRYTPLLPENLDMIKLHPVQLITNAASIVILLIALLVFDKIIQPVQRGFFCNDQSIMKPYIQKQAVPTWLLGVVAAIFVVVLVLGTEFFQRNRKENVCKKQVGHVYVGNVKIKQWIYRVISQLSLVFVGLIMNVLFTDIGKKMVGRLRPHFLSVCLPNYSKFNCSDGYITANVCTTSNKVALYEARLSFPSGHASTAAFVSVFLVLYMEYAIPLKRFYLMKPTVQFITISLGLCCGYTRISDYWHHWSDVLAGFTIGTVFALYTIFGLMNLRCSESNEMKRDSNPPIDVESQQTHSYDNQDYPNS